jgi:hypothetical protein
LRVQIDVRVSVHDEDAMAINDLFSAVGVWVGVVWCSSGMGTLLHRAMSCDLSPLALALLPIAPLLSHVGDDDCDGNQNFCVCFGVSWCVWCVCVVVLAERGSGHNTCGQGLFVCRWSGLQRRLQGTPRLGRRCERQCVCCRPVELLHPQGYGGR